MAKTCEEEEEKEEVEETGGHVRGEEVVSTSG